jgi:YegS/Rv2252/BmrU family lipid kinase
MGGDGTVSEVVNGLAGSEVKIGIIPVGTGNDIARSLHLPKKVDKCLEVILEGETKRIDVGCDGQRRFVSLLGLGFPSMVAEEANRLRFLRGPAVFCVALYKVLLRMRAYTLQITLDDVELELDCTSVLIQNTPFTGGGLLIAPGAQMDDGYLDVVLVDNISRLSLMVTVPRVYKGKHLCHPNFAHYRAKQVHIHSHERLDTMIDGDVWGVTPVHVEIEPKSVCVIVGKPNE